MLQLARAKPRYGYRRIGWLLREEGWRAGLSRVFRLWQREGLKVPVKKRKRRRLGSSANGCHRRRAEAPNDVWCWDFVFDRTVSGSQLKWLSVVDEYTRECFALKVDRGITSERRDRHALRALRDARCPEAHPQRQRAGVYRSALRRWLKQVGVGTLYIEPGSPWENGYAESFHGRLRDEFLAMEIFDGVRDARTLTASWRDEYNTQRPHSSLGYQTPARFAAACAASASAKASAPAAHAGSLGHPCS
jgi:putative transposase